MKLTTTTKFAALASLGLAASGALQAASITWGAPTTISGDTDVSTAGSLINAFTFGSNNTTTVNGVTFVPFAAGTGDTDTFPNQFGGYSSGNPPYANLSSSYKALLTGGFYHDGGNSTLTLNGLTPGTTYQVESWVNDSRACCDTRTETLDDGSGTQSGVLAYNTLQADGGVGQFIIGTFVADNSGSQVIGYNNSASSQVNGFELRSQAVPEPSTWIAAGGLLLLAVGDIRRRLRS